MAAITVSRYYSNDTDANFRLWGKAISDQLAAGGWVQTADTGQIDWTTVAKPAGISGVQGYEIWRSDDAGGGLDEIYLKIEYGAGTGNALNPGIFVTAGFASNGSGNLDGNISSRKQSCLTSNSNSILSNCYLSAGAGFAAMSLFNSLTTFGFSVERTRNSSLEFINEILFCVGTTTSGAAITNQIINKTTGAYSENSNPNGCGMINNTNAVASGNVGMNLVFGQKGGLGNPSQNVFGSTVALVGALGTVLSVDSYGETHSYIVSNINFGSSNLTIMRYE